MISRFTNFVNSKRNRYFDSVGRRICTQADDEHKPALLQELEKIRHENLLSTRGCFMQSNGTVVIAIQPFCCLVNRDTRVYLIRSHLSLQLDLTKLYENLLHSGVNEISVSNLEFMFPILTILDRNKTFRIDWNAEFFNDSPIIELSKNSTPFTISDLSFEDLPYDDLLYFQNHLESCQLFSLHVKRFHLIFNNLNPLRHSIYFIEQRIAAIERAGFGFISVDIKHVEFMEPFLPNSRFSALRSLTIRCFEHVKFEPTMFNALSCLEELTLFVSRILYPLDEPIQLHNLKKIDIQTGGKLTCHGDLFFKNLSGSLESIRLRGEELNVLHMDALLLFKNLTRVELAFRSILANYAEDKKRLAHFVEQFTSGKKKLVVGESTQNKLWINFEYLRS